MDLHPDCEPLAFLLGRWSGRGVGDYPTIERFDYLEEVTFGHVGKPFLAYAQKTRDASSGLPLHAESGYLRAIGAGAVEWVIAQPSGIVEIHTGRVADTTLVLELASVQTSPSAKSVTDVRRDYAVTDGSLRYDMHMAAVGEPLTHHLQARLDRQHD